MNSDLKAKISALKERLITTWTNSSALKKSILIAPAVASLLFLFDIAGMKLGFLNLIAALFLSVLYLFVKDGMLSPLKAVPNTIFSIGVSAGAIWWMAITKRFSVVLIFGIFLLALTAVHWLVILDKSENQLLRTALIYLLILNTVFAVIVMFAGFGMWFGAVVFGLASAAYLYAQAMLFIIALPVKNSSALSFVFSFRKNLNERLKAQKEKQNEDRIKFEQEKTRRLAVADVVSTPPAHKEEKDNPVAQKAEDPKPSAGQEPSQEAGEPDDLSDVEDIFDFLLGKPDSGSDDQKEEY